MRILLAENDNKLSKIITFLLEKENYSVDAVDNGDDAINCLTVKDYNIVILNLIMPKKNGIEICTSLRKNGKNCGIIVLAANETLNDLIKSLDNGADYCIAKPFKFPELLARIKALLRRQGSHYQQDIVSFDNGLTINRASYTATIYGTDLLLTRREFQLLNILLQNKGLTMPREQIINRIWNSADGISSNALDALVKLLRKKLAKISDIVMIRTVHGIGYKA